LTKKDKEKIKCQEQIQFDNINNKNITKFETKNIRFKGVALLVICFTFLRLDVE